MKKRLLFSALILAAVLLAAACAPAEEEMNTKLSISVKSDPFGFMENAVEEFKELHPDKEIELHNYQTDFQKYKDQVGAQLMAGEADDLISFLGFNDQKYFEGREL